MPPTNTNIFFDPITDILFIPEYHYIDRIRKGYSIEEMGVGWNLDTREVIDDDNTYNDLLMCENIKDTLIYKQRFIPNKRLHELLDTLSVDIYEDVTPVINKKPGKNEIEIIRFYPAEHGIVCVLKPGFGNFLVSNDKSLLTKIISLLTDYAFNNLEFGTDIKYQLLERNL